MPVYEYHCEACQKKFGALQPMSAPNTGAPCPHCGSTNTRRLLSTFASKVASLFGGPATSGSDCAPGG